MITKEILMAMEQAMIVRGHNAPWIERAAAAFYAIGEHGAAVVDRHELELLKSVYGFDLPDLTEPQE
jgi:hypothetical protein